MLLFGRQIIKINADLLVGNDCLINVVACLRHLIQIIRTGIFALRRTIHFICNTRRLNGIIALRRIMHFICNTVRLNIGKLSFCRINIGIYWRVGKGLTGNFTGLTSGQHTSIKADTGKHGCLYSFPCFFTFGTLCLFISLSCLVDSTACSQPDTGSRTCNLYSCNPAGTADAGSSGRTAKQ